MRDSHKNCCAAGDAEKQLQGKGVEQARQIPLELRDMRDLCHLDRARIVFHWGQAQQVLSPLFFALATGPRSLSLKLGDTRVYEPQMQVHRDPSVSMPSWSLAMWATSQGWW